MNPVIFAFLLTLFAGLSTGIGSILAFFTTSENKKFLSVALGFSAGVMIYVSMIEIFAKARNALSGSLGDTPGAWATAGAFFGGIFVILVIDKLIPSEENPHEIHKAEDYADNGKKMPPAKLMRMGMFTALAIGIHNFPEGLATFISALQAPSIAIPVAVAIAIHNIPEGVAVSAPIYYATGSKRKAFRYSFLSGLAEPVGALAGYLILMPFINDVIFGVIFAAVAGIMVFISLDELLPAAREYGEHHLSIYGLIGGMIVMALSLLLFL
ncbi:MAG: zinc transporter ZupT [Spirochaetaceae bacterium]|nr:zinc transporter ZupT [Spirochaetaceae bacterium]